MPDPARRVTSFRRLFREHGSVCVETAAGELYWLPGRYNVDTMFDRVKAAGQVDLSNWKSFKEER